jgi:hypothetical protein
MQLRFGQSSRHPLAHFKAPIKGEGGVPRGYPRVSLTNHYVIWFSTLALIFVGPVLGDLFLSRYSYFLFVLCLSYIHLSLPIICLQLCSYSCFLLLAVLSYAYSPTTLEELVKLRSRKGTLQCFKGFLRACVVRGPVDDRFLV